MVRRAGLEPAWSYPLDPKSSVSTNFTTLAFLFFGGPYRTRTCDTLIKSQMLYHLS